MSSSNWLVARSTLSRTSLRSRPVSVSSPATAFWFRSNSTEPEPKQGYLSSLLHGSQKAKAEGAEEQSHSDRVARGKYIHEISEHKVHPGRLAEYRQSIGEYYSKIGETLPEYLRLTGSWECVVGDMDTFFHIWEYEGYEGFDHAEPHIRQSEIFKQYEKQILPMLQYRKSRICQEFAFKPTAPPKELGGIYEMRTYDLRPGSLLDWEAEWRHGMEARKKHVEPIGAYFSQVGQLHTVTHLWQYKDMQTRKRVRESAWQVGRWSETVSKTVKLCYSMKANIMVPLPFSPRR